MNSQEVKKYLQDFCKVTTNFYYKKIDNWNDIFHGGNETKPSPKKGKYKIISFADRHPQRILNMNNFKERVSKYSIIDEVVVFNMSDIPRDIQDIHVDIFNSSRHFSWLAKVYLTYDVLKNSDDYNTILWIDSDIVDIKDNGIDMLFNLCSNSKKGIVGFHNDFWLEKLFTKKDLYEHLGITDPIYYNTNQAYGGLYIIEKNNFTLDFVKQWWDICCIKNLFDDSHSHNTNLDSFIEHKNCQSILSLLYKINNIKTLPIPLHDLDKKNIIASHSGYFNDGVVLPVHWEPCWHNVTIKQQWDNCNAKYRKQVSPDICLSISKDYYEKDNN